MSEKTDFGRFGKAFQESLCQLVLLDRPFSDQISEVLDLNFLASVFASFRQENF